MIKPVDDALTPPATLEQLAEECTELGKAALKLARIYRGENPTPILEEDAIENLCEEVADIRVCIRVLGRQGFAFDTIDTEYEKMRRWEKRLHEVELERAARLEHP